MLFLSYNMSNFMLSQKYFCIICNSVVHAFSEHRDQLMICLILAYKRAKTMENSKPNIGKKFGRGHLRELLTIMI